MTIATVTIADNDYEVFSDVDFADEWLAADVLRGVPWARRDEATKGRGLASATRKMLTLPWIDAPPSLDDPPDVVQQVNAMLAADMLAKPKLFSDATGASNVKMAKAGSAQVDFFRPVPGGPNFPTDLWNLLVGAGLVGSYDMPDGGGAEVSGISSGCRPRLGRYTDDTVPGFGAQDSL